jgi:hypothetical protein
MSQIASLSQRPDVNWELRYMRLRQVFLELTTALVPQFVRTNYLEAAHDLEFVEDGIVVPPSQHATFIHADYALNEVPVDGRTLVESFQEQQAYDPESDHWRILEALKNSRYSVFMVDSVGQGGLHTRDLLNANEPVYVTDMGLSQTAPPGAAIATRIVSCDGLHFTGGAALVVNVPETGSIARRFNALLQSVAAEIEETPLHEIRRLIARRLITGFTRMGGADRILDAHVTETSRLLRGGGRSLQAKSANVDHVGRNDPCPCGSGRKFKRCCGQS